jgi:hypothetical protein
MPMQDERGRTHGTRRKARYRVANGCARLWAGRNHAAGARAGER